MSTYEEAQSADPRALLSAAALGSIAGLLLGGGYVLSAHLTTTPIASASNAVGTPSARLAGVDPALQARVPLRLLPFAAEPFHTADLDGARDRVCLTQAVYYEARGEAAEGQQAVAQVVLNRVRHPAFPKSVCGVVFQRSVDGCQFSFACASHPTIAQDAAAWRRADHVAQAALDGFVMRRVGRATHYHVSTLATQWSQGLARIAQIGAHVFYGFAPHSAATRMASVRPAPAPAPVEAPAVATPAATLTLASLDVPDAARAASATPAPTAPATPIQAAVAPAPTPPAIAAPAPAAKPAT